MECKTQKQAPHFNNMLTCIFNFKIKKEVQLDYKSGLPNHNCKQNYCTYQKSTMALKCFTYTCKSTMTSCKLCILALLMSLLSKITKKNY